MRPVDGRQRAAVRWVCWGVAFPPAALVLWLWVEDLVRGAGWRLSGMVVVSLVVGYALLVGALLVMAVVRNDKGR